MRPITRTFLRLAAVCGTLHAAASIYWALGGRWLLDTVGRDAVELARDHPWSGFALLVVVAALKLGGVVVPFLVELGRLGPRRVWRAIEWVGGVVLALYGGVNTVVANLVLADVIERPHDFDERGAQGHAWLWDPLFLVWAVFLLLGLWTSRRSKLTECSVP